MGVLELKYILLNWLQPGIRFIAPNFMSLAFNTIIQAVDKNVEYLESITEP